MNYRYKNNGILLRIAGFVPVQLCYTIKWEIKKRDRLSNSITLCRFSVEKKTNRTAQKLIFK